MSPDQTQNPRDTIRILIRLSIFLSLIEMIYPDYVCRFDDESLLLEFTEDTVTQVSSDPQSDPTFVVWSRKCRNRRSCSWMVFRLIVRASLYSEPRVSLMFSVVSAEPDWDRTCYGSDLVYKAPPPHLGSLSGYLESNSESLCELFSLTCAFVFTV